MIHIAPLWSISRFPSLWTSIVDPQESAETFSFRVDKAWRQRCSQRFRNILDMIAKKAPQWWQLTNKNPTKVTAHRTVLLKGDTAQVASKYSPKKKIKNVSL